MIMAKDSEQSNYFLRDVEKLRAEAQKSIFEGAVTPDYKDAKRSVELLQGALATEIVCVLRYTMNSISVSGITSKSVAAEFAEHADDEREHMQRIAERIDQLGGVPNFDPKGLTSRSATEFGGHDLSLTEMVEQNLVAERIAIEHYRDLINYFRDRDPSTRAMLEEILADEEDHATDMLDLLKDGSVRPVVKK
jgi:bacterioferritin